MLFPIKAVCLLLRRNCWIQVEDKRHEKQRVHANPISHILVSHDRGNHEMRRRTSAGRRRRKRQLRRKPSMSQDLLCIVSDQPGQGGGVGKKERRISQ